MKTPQQRMQPLTQLGAALLVFAGAAVVVGFAVLAVPGVSFLGWILFALGLIALTLGLLTYVVRVATQALIETLEDRTD